MNKITEESGFTLIEALIAMIILSIGIMALYAMQTTATRGNAVAISITTATNRAQDQIEQLLVLPYDSPLISETGTANGCAGLNDRPGAGLKDTADQVSAADPDYTIYWNIANDCSLTEIPTAGVPVKEQQPPKHIRFFVVRTDMGVQKTIEFNYIKQNTM